MDVVETAARRDDRSRTGPSCFHAVCAASAGNALSFRLVGVREPRSLCEPNRRAAALHGPSARDGVALAEYPNDFSRGRGQGRRRRRCGSRGRRWRRTTSRFVVLVAPADVVFVAAEAAVDGMRALSRNRVGTSCLVVALVLVVEAKGSILDDHLKQSASLVSFLLNFLVLLLVVVSGTSATPGFGCRR